MPTAESRGSVPCGLFFSKIFEEKMMRAQIFDREFLVHVGSGKKNVKTFVLPISSLSLRPGVRGQSARAALLPARRPVYITSHVVESAGLP